MFPDENYTFCKMYYQAFCARHFLRGIHYTTKGHIIIIRETDRLRAKIIVVFSFLFVPCCWRVISSIALMMSIFVSLCLVIHFCRRHQPSLKKKKKMFLDRYNQSTLNYTADQIDDGTREIRTTSIIKQNLITPLYCCTYFWDTSCSQVSTNSFYLFRYLE